MSDIEVRAARADDIDLLLPLFEGYRAFYERAPDAARARAFLLDRLRHTDSAILVAVDSAGNGAGFVQLYPTFSSLQMGRALILNDLFVAPAYRGKGLGRTLMNAARAFAELSGAVSLQLETARTNDPARKLYESLGWEADEVFMQYSLDVRRR